MSTGFQAPQQPLTLPPLQKEYRGIIKQVNSGDSVVIRGRLGSKLEPRQLNLSNITAPRLGRRPAKNNAEEIKEEAYAWEAREFLRKKIIGQEVVFVVDKISNGRDYGKIYLGKDVATGENITELLVAEGLVSVRKEGKDNVKLLELEEAAKLSGKGKWAGEEGHVRDVKWTVDDSRALVDQFKRKKVSGVVEHVRDGSTIRVLLLPTYHYITLMMSGIRSPGFKLDSEGKPDPNNIEPFAEEAKETTESLLLNQDVEVILESVNNNNFVGSVIHPKGSIAEHLLREGLARCIDWSMGFVSGGSEKLRAAEKVAKEQKKRIWKDYTEGQGVVRGKGYYAIVSEIVNGDALVVKKLPEGTSQKIFIASIRAPREEKEKSEEGRKGRSLYEIPYMYEAREFLRKSCIGKKVFVIVDYVQPADKGFPEKIACTVKIDDINLGEALLSRGYGTVVRYRQDDDQRASDYDLLLAAEAKAIKETKGVHGKKELSALRSVVDITGDAAKARQFLPFFKRGGKREAVVEFVAGASRLRLFVPRESRVVTFLLGGISCPRGERPDAKTKEIIPAEPFGNEAKAFTKDLALQRDVEIEVDDIDKAGNFIGWLWIGSRNLSLSLVEEGYASVHFSAEKSNYYRALKIAEDRAKAARLNIWHDYVETVEEPKAEEEKQDRKVDLKSVVVTELSTDLKIFVQFNDDGDKLESLTSELRRELAANPPLSGAFSPKKDMVCMGKFSVDGEWYRIRVEKESVEKGEKSLSVLYIDYGNRESLSPSRTAPLPSSVHGAQAPPFAKEYALACVSLPTDEDYKADSIAALRQELTEGGSFKLNVEYKIGNVEYVTLLTENKEDVSEVLIRDGYLMVENRRERRLQSLVKDYKQAERDAKVHHRGMWEYGDITEDDAREFGMSRS